MKLQLMLYTLFLCFEVSKVWLIVVMAVHFIFLTLHFRCFSRDWRVIDYGICDLMDLLSEIPETTITITDSGTDTVISVPKRGKFELVS